MKQETNVSSNVVLMNIMQLRVTQFVLFFHSRHQFVEVVASQQELAYAYAWTRCTVESDVSSKPALYIPAYERVCRWKRNIFPYIFRLAPRAASASRVHACVIDRCRVLLHHAACAVTCRVTKRKWRRHKRTFKNHTRVDMYLTYVRDDTCYIASFLRKLYIIADEEKYHVITRHTNLISEEICIFNFYT